MCADKRITALHAKLDWNQLDHALNRHQATWRARIATMTAQWFHLMLKLDVCVVFFLQDTT